MKRYTVYITHAILIFSFSSYGMEDPNLFKDAQSSDSLAKKKGSAIVATQSMVKLYIPSKERAQKSYAFPEEIARFSYIFATYLDSNHTKEIETSKLQFPLLQTTQPSASPISDTCYNRIVDFIWRVDSYQRTHDNPGVTETIRSTEHEKGSVIGGFIRPQLSKEVEQAKRLEKQVQRSLKQGWSRECASTTEEDSLFKEEEEKNFQDRMELLRAAHILEFDLLTIALTRILIKHLKCGENQPVPPEMSPHVTPKGSPRSNQSTPRSQEGSPRDQEESIRCSSSPDVKETSEPPSDSSNRITYRQKSAGELRPLLLRRKSGDGLTHSKIHSRVGEIKQQQLLWNKIKNELSGDYAPLLLSIARFYYLFYGEHCAAAEEIPYTFSLRELRNYGHLDGKKLLKEGILDLSNQRLHKTSGIGSIKSLQKAHTLDLSKNEIQVIKPKITTSINAMMPTIETIILTDNPLTDETKKRLREEIHNKELVF